ncbi:MAG: hypothetical protein PHQ66_03860 [Candidatus Nanoarchaeia archaeon]|nr:hypothetical protein [Candidatus Nanoarchaeia archaeon]MDD5358181.1 hypothetical protein [Candidatus Nanoarchaeia archaeon]MDD5589447.1 hypothetical protein [Candidatus Nanoarchaeia archaeon]
MPIEKTFDLGKMPQEWKNNLAENCYEMLIENLESSLHGINRDSRGDIAYNEYNKCKEQLTNLGLWNEESDKLFSQAKEENLPRETLSAFIAQEKTKYKFIAK